LYQTIFVRAGAGDKAETALMLVTFRHSDRLRRKNNARDSKPSTFNLKEPAPGSSWTVNKTVQSAKKLKANQAHVE